MATRKVPPLAAAGNVTPPLSGETQLRRLIDYTNKVKAQFSDERVYVSFYETISLAKEMGVYWVYRKLCYLFHDHQDLIVEFSEFLPAPWRTPKKRRTWMTSSIRIGGGGSDVRCTSSSQFCPSSEKVCQWKSIESAVVDNTLVCMPQERDPSFQGGAIRNKHAEILALSKEMYEADMPVTTVRSAIARIRNLLHKVLAPPDRGAVVHVENHLTPEDLRCIEKIYGHVGEEIVQCVRKNPACALPRVLIRLEQKEKEWRMLQSEVTTSWKDSLARLHRPSLSRGLCNVSSEATPLPLLSPHAGEGAETNARERPSDTIGSAPVERLAGLSLSLSLEITETEKPFLFGQSLRCLRS